MKRAFSFLLIALLLCSFAVPATAANATVVFTSDSSFTAGSTVKVDDLKTRQNIIDLGKNSGEYNACIEGFVQYYWFRNDSYYADGTTLTLTEKDKGCQFYCQVYLFSDADRTQQCGVYDSAKFTVPNTDNATIPEITTKELPNGTVGESYHQKLECSDPDVVYSLFRSSLPDGLYLTQHGEIEGTPIKAGFWHVVIMVTPEAGEDYANTKEFDITISEGGSEYTLEIVQAPNKVTYTAGEKLDMTGLKVHIYTPDGYLDSVDGKYLTYTNQPLVTLGEQKISLRYEDAFDVIIVTVVAAPTTEPTNPDTSTKPTDPDVSTNPTDGTEATTDGTESTDPTTDTTNKNDSQNDKGMPWWGILLIAVAAAGAGVGITVVVLKKKK